MSWNIRQGGGTRIASIVKAIIESESTIVILSEFRNNNNGLTLRQSLIKMGFLHTVSTPAKESENSVLIASKLPFEPFVYHDADVNYSYNIVTASFSAFNVMGVYLPHKKHHSLLDYINTLVRTEDKHYIIAGDYNTGINYVDQVGNSFWYSDSLMQIQQAGYVDAFRHVHQDLREYSWYSHQGNGFRYDHTYIHEAIKPIVKDCYYIHRYREGGLSDHSPMMLVLG